MYAHRSPRRATHASALYERRLLEQKDNVAVHALGAFCNFAAIIHRLCIEKTDVASTAEDCWRTDLAHTRRPRALHKESLSCQLNDFVHNDPERHGDASVISLLTRCALELIISVFVAGALMRCNSVRKLRYVSAFMPVSKTTPLHRRNFR